MLVVHIEFTEWVEEVAIVRNTIARSSLQATVTRRAIKVLHYTLFEQQLLSTFSQLFGGVWFVALAYAF